MKALWAPWRMEYLKSSEKPDECILCVSENSDEDHDRLVVFRGEDCFVMMNRYPYSNGHLMVAPFRHLAEPGLLSAVEALEMHRLTTACQEMLRSVGDAEGFNLGMNVGKAAGAGIAGHIHQHIVPRWYGDTNFMPIFADVRVIPEHLEATWRQLREAFSRFSL